MTHRTPPTAATVRLLVHNVMLIAAADVILSEVDRLIGSEISDLVMASPAEPWLSRVGRIGDMIASTEDDALRLISVAEHDCPAEARMRLADCLAEAHRELAGAATIEGVLRRGVEVYIHRRTLSY